MPQAPGNTNQEGQVPSKDAEESDDNLNEPSQLVIVMQEQSLLDPIGDGEVSELSEADGARTHRMVENAGR